MPLVTLSIPEKIYTRDQKQALIEKITEAIAEVGGEKQRPLTKIMVQEYPEGNWGSSGKVYIPKGN